MAGFISRVRWIADLVRRRNAARAGVPAGELTDPPRPEIPVAIVGDIHGRADLLDILLAKLSTQAPEAKLIFVGDYVDRGAQSREVIEILRRLGDGPVFLKGNHEVMLLEFLDDPIEKGGRWVRNGGIATLASFGIELGENSNVEQVLGASADLAAALAGGGEEWLRNLALFWRSGNLLVTHAGPDPAAAISNQDDRSFLWGHSRFLRDARSDGIWVAHGHWARDHVYCRDGRIGVDTTAWSSGRLSAAIVTPDGGVRFIAAP